MSDKEKIIIDGVNVLECEHYEYKSFKDCEMRYPESGDCEIGLLNYLFNGNLDIEKHCIDNPNCYFKQLQHKEQECEKYKQTLDEFELLITNHILSCEKCPDNKNGYCIGIDECSNRCLKKILDIINKAKDTTNE